MWSLLLCAGVLASVCARVSGGRPNNCYQYYDHAAQYNLDYVANSYPWDEVKQAMTNNPMLSQVFATGTKVPTSRPPNAGRYYQPVSVVCPSQRFMLKAFKVGSKQCWVIKPEIQQVRYVKCSSKDNRDCHYCSYNKGGISKCEEDYEWQKVWAYCKPFISYPQPRPHPVPQPKPYVPPVYPQPYVPQVKPQPKPYLPPVNPYNPKPQPKPYVPPVNTGYPKPQPRPYVPVYRPKPTVGGAIFAKKPAPTYYDPWRAAQKTRRWKRSVPNYQGSVQQITLYLPYQCSCKNFQC